MENHISTKKLAVESFNLSLLDRFTAFKWKCAVHDGIDASDFLVL